MEATTLVVGIAALALLSALVLLLARLDRSLRSVAVGLERGTHGTSTGGTQPIAVTLDLDRALASVAAAALAVKGVDAAAARIRRVDGSDAQHTVGITSGATGLDGVPDPPGRATWDVVRLAWGRATDGDADALLGGVVVPLIHEGVRIGLLGAWSRSAGGPADTAVEELRALAESAVPTLAAAREHQAIQELVRTDPLTGLLNRRGFDDTLAREIARARRSGSPLTLLALDLDNFRAANSVAHVHGDEALRAFARVISDACRTTDFACRRGGDEFTVILPDTGCIEGLRVDARIRALASATEMPHLGHVRYSSGVAQLADGDDAATLDERASELVNRVKREGRDGVHHDLEP